MNSWEEARKIYIEHGFGCQILKIERLKEEFEFNPTSENAQELLSAYYILVRDSNFSKKNTKKLEKLCGNKSGK